MGINELNALNRMLKCGQPDFFVYTDGSAGEGVMDGGAGVVVTTGSPAEPVVVDVIERAAGRVSTSHQAEVHALRTALQWLSERFDWNDVMIACDSMAALNSLRGCRGCLVDGALADCARLLNDCCRPGRKIRFIWVPGLA